MKRINWRNNPFYDSSLPELNIERWHGKPFYSWKLANNLHHEQKMLERKVMISQTSHWSQMDRVVPHYELSRTASYIYKRSLGSVGMPENLGLQPENLMTKACMQPVEHKRLTNDSLHLLLTSQMRIMPQPTGLCGSTRNNNQFPKAVDLLMKCLLTFVHEPLCHRVLGCKIVTGSDDELITQKMKMTTFGPSQPNHLITNQTEVPRRLHIHPLALLLHAIRTLPTLTLQVCPNPTSHPNSPTQRFPWAQLQVPLVSHLGL